jgi:phenylpyruvate tautomerase PptA (4-oxalocrotonate tautomerase family)
MPLIEVKLLENRITPEQREELALKLVETFTSVAGEQYRDLTFCIVEEVPEKSWAFAGKVY